MHALVAWGSGNGSGSVFSGPSDYPTYWFVKADRHHCPLGLILARGCRREHLKRRECGDFRLLLGEEGLQLRLAVMEGLLVDGIVTVQAV